MGEIATRLQAELEAAVRPQNGPAGVIRPQLGLTVLALINAVARLESVVAELELRLDEITPPPPSPARTYPPRTYPPRDA